ncbi:unnamed protein product [Heligmosomoides polygyrus]|uniref:Phlebovirus_G2 domain-containing protein n=1 Tax=Heligmosomoides polygyrus TaxID=6339 RepID=A0A183GAM7_HELPZ|nr:unnamed protein product [Heligmosomoides polygyrus]
MAACVYLVHMSQSTLLVAKSKLPSIEDNPMNPKLEMNALTMAARLVSMTLRLIKQQLSVRSVTLYSDSEIFLAWLASPSLDRNAGVLRLNNLPYRYPALSDLPSRRVTRSRLFQHVGIDYFEPNSIKSDGEAGKAYGIILTPTNKALDRRGSKKFLPPHLAILEHLERAISYRSQRTTYTLPLQQSRHTKGPYNRHSCSHHGSKLPRNTWNMGRITKVNANKEGVIREVELILPSKRITRRPINLLVPLGLKDEEENEDTMPSSPRQGNDTDSGIRNVDCWFCTANIFNTECQPRAAIIALAVNVYAITALLYALCYIPVVIGRPCRVLLAVCFHILRVVWAIVKYLRRTITRRQNRRLHRSASRLGFVPLVLVISGLPAVLICQDVDIFDHKTTVCSTSKSNRQVCITEVIKINSFSKEACFRLQNQGNVLKEIRVKWNELRPLCDKHTTMFTRNMVLRFSGVTFCVESCGEPGCGRFYISSGCLFYRIYAQPLIDDVLEIFRCPRWKEEVLVELTVRDGSKLTKNVTTALVPTIPQEMHGMRLKMSVLTVPPTPALQTSFISDGKNIALWTEQQLPALQCLSHEDAKLFQCDVHPNCKCQPAELTINCVCVQQNLTADFHTELRNHLPVRRPWITFEEDLLGAENVSVRAIVPSLATAELLMTVNEEIDSTVKQITDSVCKVSNAEINGCYHCPREAVAQITCISQDNDTLATVACEDYTFSVPCTTQGVKSSIRFNFQQAHVHLACTSPCGYTKNPFELNGVLHWT